ncbi:MAG TPA: cytosine permease, partial [Bacillota bacterium]
ALWTTADNNIYSSGLAFTNVGDLIGLRLSKPAWTLVSITIAVLVSLLGLAGNFLTWLRFISIAVAPFAGVVLAHFWLIHKGRGVGPAPDGVRWIALVAWLAATIFAYYYRGWVPAVPALILAGLVYWGLSMIAPVHERANARPARGE